MNRCGLNSADFAAYVACLRSSAYTSAIEVDVLDMAGQRLYSLADDIDGGQIDIDATREPARILTLTVLDPHHALGFDSTSPANGALFADRMLRVTHRTYVPALGDHVRCEMFTGPIRAVRRNGDEVELTAHGMERLALGNIWDPISFHKGAKKISVIRTLMGERAGETKFSMAALDARLPTPLALTRTDVPWREAKKLASSMDVQLYYNGPGRLVLRHWPAKPLLWLRQGDDDAGNASDVTGPVEVALSLEGEWYNVIDVRGAQPRGTKRRVRAVSVAPPNSPLAPKRLGHNGAMLTQIQVVSNAHIRSDDEALTKARRLLVDQLRRTVSVTFDCKVFPFLDEGDVIGVNTHDGAVEFRLNQFTIPLAPGDSMSVGYQRRMKAPRLPKRRVHRKRD